MPGLVANRVPPVSARFLEGCGVAAIVLAVLAVYGQVGAHRPIPFDDSLYLTDNAWVQRGLTLESVLWAFRNVDAANWHPLTWLSHMLDQEVFGDLIGGHMVINPVWHALNSILLSLLLQRLGIPGGVSWSLAFVFAVHPVNVESVAWLSQRKTQLSTFLLLASLLEYLEWRSTGRRLAWIVCVAAFTMSLMAKAMGVTLPAILVVFELRGVLSALAVDTVRMPVRALLHAVRDAMLRVVPLMIAALVVAVVTWWAQSDVGAVASLGALSPLQRVANAATSVGIYLQKFVWPGDLCFFYPINPRLDWSAASGSLLVVLLLTLACLMLAKSFPNLIFGWLWFLISLLPVIGLVQVGAQSHADRYMYFPMMGLLVGLGGVFGSIPIPGCRAPARFLAAGATIFAVGLGIHAYAYVMKWRSPEVAYRHAIAVAGPSFHMVVNLASTLTSLGYLRSAEPWAARAQRAWPDQAMTHANMAGLQARLERYGDAEANLRRAIAIDPEDFRHYYMLGIVLAHLERAEEAEAALQRAKELMPPASNWRSSNQMARAVLERRVEVVVAGSASSSDLLEPVR